MKKYIIALMGLSGIALATGTPYVEEGTEITFSSDLSKGSDNGGGYAAISFTLNPVSDSGRFTSDLAEGSLLSPQLSLTSITICGRYSASKAFAEGNIRLVIVDPETYEVLGINNNGNQSYSTSTAGASSPTDVPITFTFSDVVLSSTQIDETTPQRYLGLFVADSGGTLDSNLTKGTTYDVNSEAYDVYRFNFAARGAGYDSTSALDWSFATEAGEVQSNTYVPYLTIATKSLAVPEPTTATLSLLALCGLAARRRRK